MTHPQYTVHQIILLTSNIFHFFQKYSQKNNMNLQEIYRTCMLLSPLRTFGLVFLVSTIPSFYLIMYLFFGALYFCCLSHCICCSMPVAKVVFSQIDKFHYLFYNFAYFNLRWLFTNHQTCLSSWNSQIKFIHWNAEGMEWSLLVFFIISD